MPLAMAVDSRRQEAYPEVHLRRQLAATVTRIQWSYAIFWSNLRRQQGALTWSDGYYNGEIKTRKTTQPIEFQDDPMGLQRSEQLRELYLSLSAGDSNQQSRRPSASLTPEDLTNTEWYYLVCMSFTFTPGQCLPGRALMRNQNIWLADARFADVNLFTRSLLAKSASIRTVVCFPFMDGILEFGTTELVLEDSTIVQQIKTSFSEAPPSACFEQSLFNSSLGNRDEDISCPILDHDIIESVILSNHDAAAPSQAHMENVHPLFPLTIHSFPSNEQNNGIHVDTDSMNKNMCDEVNEASSGESSYDCCADEENEDSFLIEGLNDMSQVQMTGDDFRNRLNGSLSSNDFVSVSVNPQRQPQHSSPRRERMNKFTMLDSLQEGDYITSTDPEGDDDSHYWKTMATVLRQSHQHTLLVPCFSEVPRKSSFTVWKKDLSFVKPLTFTPQKMLKNILMCATKTSAGRRTNVSAENGRPATSEGDDADNKHAISEHLDMNLVLRTIVPSISKVDKAPVLGDTNDEHLKELEKKVGELESCRDFMELEARGRRRKHPDVAERTSDNYGSKGTRNAKKPCANKRELCNTIGEAHAGRHRISAGDGHANVNVAVVGKEVLMNMRCPWRDCLLMEAFEAISNLHLDPYSVQSSTVDGIVKLTVKSKFMDSGVASPEMIKRALRRVVAKY